MENPLSGEGYSKLSSGNESDVVTDLSAAKSENR